MSKKLFIKFTASRFQRHGAEAEFKYLKKIRARRPDPQRRKESSKSQKK